MPKGQSRGYLGRCSGLGRALPRTRSLELLPNAIKDAPPPIMGAAPAYIRTMAADLVYESDDTIGVKLVP